MYIHLAQLNPIQTHQVIACVSHLSFALCSVIHHRLWSAGQQIGRNRVLIFMSLLMGEYVELAHNAELRVVTWHELSNLVRDCNNKNSSYSILSPDKTGLWRLTFWLNYKKQEFIFNTLWDLKKIKHYYFLWLEVMELFFPTMHCDNAVLLFCLTFNLLF